LARHTLDSGPLVAVSLAQSWSNRTFFPIRCVSSSVFLHSLHDAGSQRCQGTFSFASYVGTLSEITDGQISHNKEKADSNLIAEKVIVGFDDVGSFLHGVSIVRQGRHDNLDSSMTVDAETGETGQTLNAVSSMRWTAMAKRNN